MKKILISSGIIAAVAVVVVGGTMAYLNDTETSAGNIFVAGELDLKVDHKFASYNGNPCIKECVPNLSQSLTFDESFELPVVMASQKWDIYDSPVHGWNVEWRGDIPGSVNGWTRPDPAHLELHRGVLGSAQNGLQYAELDSDWNGHSGTLSNEPASVKIYQDIVTVPGKKYLLKFAFSPRPNTVANNNKLEVRWNGGVVVVLGPVAGGGSMNWQEYSYDVTASGATTRLEFTDLGTADSLGTFVDNIRLYPYECTYKIIGGTCTLWDLKDLGQGDYYWNYNDVKPGDWGINIISLHAYDNDAYACLITHNIVDAEDTMVDPEIEAGDDIASVIGELSGFIHVFAWEDTNQNNAYDNGEPIIANPNTPIKDAIGKISLTASHTKYIGIAWCAGTQGLNGNTITCDGSGMSNIAQTDIMTASITAYVEQQRNNENFDCSKVVLPAQ